MKACRLAIILAVSLSAVNALALQSASTNPCNDCNDQPPRFELGVAASGIHLSDNNNFGIGTRASSEKNELKLKTARPPLKSFGRALFRKKFPSPGIQVPGSTRSNFQFSTGLDYRF